MSPYQDLRTQLAARKPGAVNLFDATIIASAANRDFFAWEENANGMMTPNSRGFSAELERLSYPAIGSTPVSGGGQRPDKPVLIMLPLLLNSGGSE